MTVRALALAVDARCERRPDLMGGDDAVLVDVAARERDALTSLPGPVGALRLVISHDLLLSVSRMRT